jgi:hypothetical protein
MLVLPGKAYSKKHCKVHQLQDVRLKEFENLNTNKNFVELFAIQWLIDAKGTFKMTENIVTHSCYAGHPLPRGDVTWDTAVTTQL